MDGGKDSGQKPRRPLDEPVFRTSVIRKYSALVYLSSRIEPLLEVHLKARKHLFFNVFDVGELAPTSDIALFAGALKLHNEFLHQPPACRGIFPGDAVCKWPPFFFRFLVPNPILCQDRKLERFQETNSELRWEEKGNS